MTSFRCFLDLPDADPRQADVLLLPLPYEGTVSYGRGTAGGPEAIWSASRQIECWDEELDWDLESLAYFSSEPVTPPPTTTPEAYVQMVCARARTLHQYGGLVVGVGGEHGVTPALVAAACPDPGDLSRVTVVQIDAHADLRDQYGGTSYSHACAMRRLADQGASILAIGIRSAEREEFQYGHASGRIETFFAQALAEDPRRENQLMDALGRVQGACYLTVDMDGLACSLCPGTGTPHPGGLGWWQTLRYLRCLLLKNPNAHLTGFDVVETVPQATSQVNQLAAAKLLTKVLAYHFCSARGASR